MSAVSRLFGSADGLPDAISTDVGTALALLKNDRRRLTIHVVAASASTDVDLDIGVLVDAIAAHEYGCEPRHLDTQERKRVYIGLRQTHVPRLARDGALKVDDTDRQAEIWANELTHELDQLARSIEEVATGGVVSVDFEDGRPEVSCR